MGEWPNPAMQRCHRRAGGPRWRKIAGLLCGGVSQLSLACALAGQFLFPPAALLASPQRLQSAAPDFGAATAGQSLGRGAPKLGEKPAQPDLGVTRALDVGQGCPKCRRAALRTSSSLARTKLSLAPGTT